MARRISRREALKYSAATGAMATGLAGVPRLAAAADPLKVGIVYVSPISEIGWTKQHSLGAQAIADTFGERVSITAIDNVWDPQAGERVFAELASTGHGLVFGTSFSHSTPIQKTAPRFPDVAFEHCSGLKHSKNLGTFEAKYYEGTYLAGIAGGHVSESKKLGFIGGFPIPDIVGPGNAMLLGAQSVDPSITCSVIFLNSWFDPAKEKEATAALVAQGCDVICSMTDTATGVQVAEQNGAWSIGYASDMRQFGPTKNLTSFMLDWTSVYVGAARDVLDGAWTSQVRWQGVKEGVVTMSPYNDQLPGEVIDQLTAAEAAIRDGSLHPYKGELRDQQGNVRVEAGSRLSDPDIRGFNWFVEGMIGNLEG